MDTKKNSLNLQKATDKLFGLIGEQEGIRIKYTLVKKEIPEQESA